MMKVIELTAFGDASGFKETERDRPEPGAGELLVRVESSSVNPIDTKIRAGAVPAVSPELPAILHGDVAGVVESVGEGVEAFAPGQTIWACAGGVKGVPGALAEYMIVDSRLAATAPGTLPATKAGALPLVGITAWLAVIERARVAPGERVLIHGGTGGVGHVAVQLAKRAGAHVTATVSSAEKVATARELGADEVILRPETPENAFDAVIDTIGGENLNHSFRQVGADGRIVTIAARATADLTPLHGKNATFHAVFMLPPLLTGRGREAHGEILARLARLLEQGAVKPLIADTLRFPEVARAHGMVEAGGHLGKIVLAGW